MKKLNIAVLVAACGVGASSMGFAEEWVSGTGPFIGAKYGGFKSSGGDFDDERDFYELLAGYQFSPYLAVEGNYTDFGSYGNSLTRADVDGFGAAVVGQLPITNVFALYAKGGMFWSDGDVEVLNVSGHFDDKSPYYGLGANLMFSEYFGLNMEYKRYELEYDSSTPDFDDDDSDLDTLTVGASYYF